MTARRSRDRPGVTGLALREAVRASLAPLRWLARGNPRRGPQPQRVLFAPQDLRTGDPTVFDEFRAGLFVLAGTSVETPGSPFDASDVPSAWTEALCAFGWLRHLRAAAAAGERDGARAIVADALGRPARVFERGPGRRTHVVARRVVALLCGSSLVLTGADHALYARYLARIGRDVAALERDLVGGREADRLAAAIALSYAALCCSGLENRVRRAVRALSGELSARLLPDGGHVSRNPAVAIELLLDLLPLRLLFASRGVDIPDALPAAIDGLFPFLRHLRHGNGEIALFNGMGTTPVDHLASLFAYDAHAPDLTDATPSGYARLAGGGLVVVVDVGEAPPAAFSTQAGAGIGALEVSGGVARLIVNAGTPRAGPDRLPARRTAAFSTLAVGDGSTLDLLPDHDSGMARWLGDRLGPVVLAGPRAEVSRARGADEAGVTLRHDGFVRGFGVAHERRLTLGPDGVLLGEDRLIPQAGTARVTAELAVRFHLHPSVAVERTGGRAGAILTDRTGARWLFTARTGAVEFERSLYHGGIDRAARTTCLVVRPEIDVFHGATELGWSLRRLPEGGAGPEDVPVTGPGEGGPDG